MARSGDNRVFRPLIKKRDDPGIVFNPRTAILARLGPRFIEHDVLNNQIFAVFEEFGQRDFVSCKRRELVLVVVNLHPRQRTTLLCQRLGRFQMKFLLFQKSFALHQPLLAGHNFLMSLALSVGFHPERENSQKKEKKKKKTTVHLRDSKKNLFQEKEPLTFNKKTTKKAASTVKRKNQ
jgi:hypothetical protein